MNRKAYLEETLIDLKKEQRQESHKINSLKEMLAKLQHSRYQPLDSLEQVITDLESRRGTLKATVDKIESLL